jgi:general secretion pathway protein G
MNTKKGRPAMLEKLSGVITARIHNENDQNDEEGFTLIELLIVVIVLGILAAVTVFGLSGSATKSAKAACHADARTAEVAVDAFHTASLTNSWPGAWTDLTAPAAGTLGQPPGVTPYLRTTPGDPGHYTMALMLAGDGTIHVQVTPLNGLPAGDYDATNGAVCDTVT